MMEFGNEPEPGVFASDEPDPATDANAARKKAMDCLARREYGRKELVGRLKAAGFEQDVADDTVATLAAEGLQDDLRFATSFARARAGRGTGPLRIRQALKEKGLAGNAVEAAFEDLDTDWFRQAREVRERKFGRAQPENFKEKARQMRFLQYRGFDQAEIRAAIGDVDD